MSAPRTEVGPRFRGYELGAEGISFDEEPLGTIIGNDHDFDGLAARPGGREFRELLRMKDAPTVVAPYHAAVAKPSPVRDGVGPHPFQRDAIAPVGRVEHGVIAVVAEIFAQFPLDVGVSSARRRVFTASLEVCEVGSGASFWSAR